MKLLIGEPECRPSTFEVQQWARLAEAITLGIASESLGCFRELDIQVVIGEDWQDVWDLVTVLESLFGSSPEPCAQGDARLASEPSHSNRQVKPS
jgi:hypothetical protein